RLDVAGLMKRLHRHFGNHYRYLGGGAGTRSGSSIPCVFTAEQGLHESAAVLGFFTGASTIHAGHGWHRAIGPVVATKTSGDIIAELNWRPAYPVYRQLIRQATGVDIDGLPFVDVGLKYPLGMLKEDAEDLVRVPLRITPEEGLAVIGGIPTHSVLHVLSGAPEDLIGAGAESARRCTSSLGRSARTKLLFDCVTRPADLQERYVEELEAIQDGLRPLGPATLIGALARGEVCGMAGGIPEWLNKTTVIGAFA
ncbi:MAG: FIST C-terminal domain-containing protein, partial [Pseudomonadota bacterium]